MLSRLSEFIEKQNVNVQLSKYISQPENNITNHYIQNRKDHQTILSKLDEIHRYTLQNVKQLCIFTEQFYRTRAGDRFFYENGGPNIGPGFTLKQLNEIRKASMAKLLCDNGHNITTVQPFTFIKLSHSNPLTPCEHIPDVNLLLWKQQESHGINHADEFF
ncbi:hypothetical protein FQR65_LT14087 [Abscondita terminalis]|nr:hypothetical protein FQR65_LT14087 [Abscondita terminalis]